MKPTTMEVKTAKVEKFDVYDFNLVYKHYSNRILQVIQMKVKNREDCEDIHAETLVKINRYLKSYNPAKGAFSTFIFGIMHSCIIDHYRKHKAHNYYRTNVADFTDSEGNETFNFSHDDKTIENNEIAESLEKAVKQLKPVYQQIFELYRKGYEYNEISELMDIPLNSIKVMILRAKEVLRGELAGIYV